VGINRDITERKQMETTLKQSEARFRLLIEESPLGIAVVRNGLLLYANQALLGLFGYQALPDLAQADLLERVAMPDRQRIQAVMQEKQLTPPFTLELLGQRTDGSVFPALLRVGLIPLGDGPAYIAFVTDITERKRLEEERMVAERLQVELDKEKELSDLKDRFISMVSHEYRTPLAVILSSTDLLRSYADHLPPDKKQKLLDDIRIQVNYMAALLEDVLTISKARTGRLTLNPVRVDVETYCQRVFEAVQLADHGVHRFTLIKASEPVGCAEVDDHLLRQILTNLLSNAAKYSPQDTEIRLELGCEAPHLIFRVSDQGIGIPEADQARLFEPFHRAQNVGTTQGTGLGLTVVKHNVEALGGTITFTSELGVGTTFTVRLPVLADDVNPPFFSSGD
jgi:PAS domain S-box-containing protein